MKELIKEYKNPVDDRISHNGLVKSLVGPGVVLWWDCVCKSF